MRVISRYGFRTVAVLVVAVGVVVGFGGVAGATGSDQPSFTNVVVEFPGGDDMPAGISVCLRYARAAAADGSAVRSDPCRGFAQRVDVNGDGAFRVSDICLSVANTSGTNRVVVCGMPAVVSGGPDIAVTVACLRHLRGVADAAQTALCGRGAVGPDWPRALRGANLQFA